MLDIFETLFIWGLYVAFPIVLIIHLFGIRNSVTFFTVFALLNVSISVPEVTNQPDYQSQIVIERVRGGSDRNPLKFGSKKTKIDLNLHRKLEKYFPDWGERMDYQKEQEKVYKAAMKRQNYLRQTGLRDIPQRYTKEELDAIAYFQGTGFYKSEQDPKRKPNLFDTRQSFLIKMQDEKMRNDFLSSFNRINN